MASRLTMDEVESLLAEVSEADSKDDPEVAHGIEDDLMRRFVEHCTTSQWQPSEVRAMACKIHVVSGDNSRTRWYA